MTLLDHPLIAQRYFFPRPGPAFEAFAVAVDGAVLACHRHEVDAAAPWVVQWHGNGEIVADYLPWWPQLLAARGYNSLLAEYRGYGSSTGAPALAVMLDDAERTLAALGVADERVVVFGRSVGSIYAVHVASRRPGLAGLVIESGIADPLQRILLRVTPAEIGASAQELAAAAGDQLDHRRKLAAWPGPTLVLHTRDDGIVDLDHGQRLHDWAAGERKRLVVFEEGNHNTIFAANHAAYLDALFQFLDGLT